MSGLQLCGLETGNKFYMCGIMQGPLTFSARERHKQSPEKTQCIHHVLQHLKLNFTDIFILFIIPHSPFLGI